MITVAATIKMVILIYTFPFTNLSNGKAVYTLGYAWWYGSLCIIVNARYSCSAKMARII